MIAEKDFQKLKLEQKEHILTALFATKFKGASAESGVTFDVPAGYSVRAATLLTFEEQKEIVKKIFVLLEESNSTIRAFDVEVIIELSNHLAEAEAFLPSRDELWVISNKSGICEAYKHERGKIVLLGIDSIIRGIQKYFNKKDKKSRELRDVLRHYGLS